MATTKRKSFSASYFKHVVIVNDIRNKDIIKCCPRESNQLIARYKKGYPIPLAKAADISTAIKCDPQKMHLYSFLDRFTEARRLKWNDRMSRAAMEQQLLGNLLLINKNTLKIAVQKINRIRKVDRNTAYLVHKVLHDKKKIDNDFHDKDVADALRINPSAISQIKHGGISVPLSRSVGAARVLDIDPLVLFLLSMRDDMGGELFVKFVKATFYKNNALRKIVFDLLYLGDDRLDTIAA